MRRQRRAAWLLVAGLGLVLCGYAAWRLDYRPWPPGVVRRLPPSETLIYLDLRPLRGDLAGAPAVGSAYAAFVRDSGFDFTRDLDQLALALRGDPAHPASTCAILAGRFPAGFAAYLNQHAERRLSVAGLAAWQFPGLARPRQTMTVALLAPNLLVVTNAPAPASDIRHAEGGGNRAPRLWRAALWRPRPVAYLAADTLRLAAEGHLDGVQPPWAGAQRFEVSLRLALPDHLTLRAVEQASDAQSATRAQAWFSRRLRALIAVLGRNPLPGAPLAALLRQVRLSRSGSRLSATLGLNRAGLHELLALTPRR